MSLRSAVIDVMRPSQRAPETAPNSPTPPATGSPLGRAVTEGVGQPPASTGAPGATPAAPGAAPTPPAAPQMKPEVTELQRQAQGEALDHLEETFNPTRALGEIKRDADRREKQ